eukprot:11923196-Prorocentrum_lima.AAC.1
MLDKPDRLGGQQGGGQTMSGHGGHESIDEVGGGDEGELDGYNERVRGSLILTIDFGRGVVEWMWGGFAEDRR